MAKPLVIVESPAKAKTIGSILGGDYVVEACVGHIRDLPRSSREIPEAQRNEAVQRTGGVDVDNDFAAVYVVHPEKKAQITKLKGLLKSASELYLATDEDREGESIAWHLLEVLAPKVPVKRMVFHEITKSEILSAVANPRELDRRLVDAQEARRILDRLVGWELSPVLWRKVVPQAPNVTQKLSAGRVQSVATKIIVDRERERIRFNAAGYWDIEGTFESGDGTFGAKLDLLDGVRLATGNDFGDDGALKRENVVVLDEEGARGLTAALQGVTFTVGSVEEKPRTQRPSPPFMTSTLQQEASRKLRFGAARTMSLAQKLYEGGFITYMRTDSVTLSETALQAARRQAADMFGPEFVPQKPRVYASKVKNAQEAHEAIRPAGESFRTPDQVSREVGADELRLYDLIWKRTIASQMADAQLQAAEVRLAGTATDGRQAGFVARGQIITFPGFRRAYVEGSDDPDAALDDQEVRLPRISVGEQFPAATLDPKSHETKPPARFTEASLVKALEEYGVGRPSTYASIIGKIQDVGYCWKKGSALVPTYTAFAVVQLLERYFGTFVDETFTARMEDELDEIAAGDMQTVPWLTRFYFGNGQPGLRTLVSPENLDQIDPREVGAIPIGEHDGEPVVVRVGRYGPYVQHGERRASLPPDITPDEFTTTRALELLDAPSQDRELGAHPETGEAIWVKAGRFGPYIQMGILDTEDKKAPKPKTASLFKTMSTEAVSLEDALQLLSLPRLVGEAADGEPITAQNGRYGPYITKGAKDSRSLEAEEQLFTVTLEEALVILAQPRTRRGQKATAPLREVGVDPVSEQPIVLKEGRFGPYVTDGETNASLRTGDTVEEITLERASELLADRRARGPAKGAKKKTATKTAKKSTAKKTAKKSTAKKAAKKTAAKKTAAKRSPTTTE